MKRTAKETRDYIAALESEIKTLRSRVDEADPIEGFAEEMRALIAFMPERERYVGDPARTHRSSLHDALLDIEAEHWDAHHVSAVFELCERAGFRPKSRAPADIEEAAESILLKYPR